MEKMVPKSPHSGKRAIASIAALVLFSTLAFSAASRAEPGAWNVVLLVSGFVLLALALCEAVQWIWRTRPRGTGPDA
ncbi:hypothetical protein [Leucobacter chromiireducens]|uniref:hypothetical protein n=1 Tax=Leucobacter chromiireducens TaxID=283877 RepID=UPI003F7E77AE